MKIAAKKASAKSTSSKSSSSSQKNPTKSKPSVVAKEKKVKKVKDANAPKRPLSSYLFFSTEKGKEVRQEHPDWSVGDVSKEVGRMWRELSDEDRVEYEEKASEAKERYQEEMKSYVPPPQSEMDENKKKTKPKSGFDEEGNAKPKKGMTSFLFYSGAMREKVKAANPEMKIGEVAKVLGAQWKNLETKEKAKWEKMAEKDKVRYERDMESYRNGNFQATV